ncbi:bacterial regulatory helix-turn-helix, lysR family protein [Collimonas fungivorans]|uniref:Bacterial regulatory helix-turn-helix, lysR family protein n=1 Tax=Collimonas fungivorans TaxID=158899 RepID=A0A127PFP6_9BURK|nr:LysR substrate-binding domain-containing protein [Collimonas fungivorans]AMO96567.1 bacterial regulatory helix-turn-helix, lysR family protein [Collimonas fungivorans]
MRQISFDLDVLRTFTTGIDLGSYAKAADRLGRSTSAVSAQLKKLEEQAGAPIFRKAGRGLALTEAGQTLLGYARRLLDLNDETASAVRGVELEGEVKLGLQEDFGEALLSDVLGRFMRAHPKVRVEVCVARSTELRERVTLGRIDLALMWECGAPTLNAQRVADLPLCWIGPAQDVARAQPGAPLSLVLLDAPCMLRDIASNALDAAGIAWRHAFTSASLSALWAASAAGLGLTVRTPIGLPASLRIIEPQAAGLPALPQIGLSLYRAQTRAQTMAEPALNRLEELLLQAVHETIRRIAAA